MKTLEIDPFITELGHLFSKHKAAPSGSFYITLKRWNGHPKSKKKATQKATSSSADSSESANEPRLLVRAVSGEKRKRKFNTSFSAKDVNRFSVAFSSTLRSGIDGLKKKEKQKDTKTAKQQQQQQPQPQQPQAAKRKKTKPASADAATKQAQPQAQRSPTKKAKSTGGNKPTPSS